MGRAGAFFGSGIAIFRFGAFVGILGEEAGVTGMGRGVCVCVLILGWGF